jgi:hypothetical protein
MNKIVKKQVSLSVLENGLYNGLLNIENSSCFSFKLDEVLVGMQLNEDFSCSAISFLTENISIDFLK